MAVEEVTYSVLKTTDTYELRDYNKSIVVQTTQSNGENGAFMRLFRYISGSNQSSQKIAMTSPVTQFPVNGTSVMQFFLPSGYTMDQAPKPTDPSVSISEITAARFAVIQFSGRSNDANFNKHALILQDALKRDGIKTIGEPIKASFNGPFTPPFMRKNETMIQIAR